MSIERLCAFSWGGLTGHQIARGQYGWAAVSFLLSLVWLAIDWKWGDSPGKGKDV